MKLKINISYFKNLINSISKSKKCNKKYSLGEVRDFIDTKILPPTPLYQDAYSKRLHKNRF